MRKFVLGMLSLIITLLLFAAGCAAPPTNMPGTSTTYTPPVINTTTTTAATPTLNSIYDGTYTGVFSYEYQKRESLDYLWTENGTWTPASFIVTLTFKTVEITGEYVKLNITKVTCSEAIFGAVDGVVPWQNDDTYAYLPVNPPTGPNNIAPAFMGINVSFPNFSVLEMPTLTRDGISLPGCLAVGANGISLGNTAEPAIQGWAWRASTPSGVFMNPSAWGYYRHRFVSWNLTKISN